MSNLSVKNNKQFKTSMKNKNKSRLTRIDVNKICEMQHRIERFNQYILSIYSLVIRKKENIMLQEDEDDAYSCMASDVIRKLINELKKDRKE